MHGNMNINFILILFLNLSLSLPRVLRFSKIKTLVLLCFILLGTVNLLLDAKNPNHEARQNVARLTTADVVYIGLFSCSTPRIREWRFGSLDPVVWDGVQWMISFCWLQLDKFLHACDQPLHRNTKIMLRKVECNLIQERTGVILVSFFFTVIVCIGRSQ
jgi:hypothetical protein